MNKLFLIIISITAVSCMVNKSITSDNLYGNKWKLKSITSLSDFENAKFSNAGIFFSKNDSVFSGSNGCNQYSGKFSIENEDMKLGETLSTMRACSGIDESKFNNVLKETNKYKLVKSTLIFYHHKTKLAEFVLVK